MKASFKKNILIGIVSIAGVFLLAAACWLLYFNAQFSVYQDTQYKFSIKYPKTWNLVIHPKDTIAVIFLRPKDTALDTLQENFNVTVQEVPPDVFKISDFSAKIKKQMTGVFGKSVTFVEDKPIHWGWREGHKMAIEAANPNHLKMVNAWVLYHNQAYILTFLGDMRKYPQDSLLVNEMIRSLQLQ